MMPGSVPVGPAGPAVPARAGPGGPGRSSGSRRSGPGRSRWSRRCRSSRRRRRLRRPAPRWWRRCRWRRWLRCPASRWLLRSSRCRSGRGTTAGAFGRPGGKPARGRKSKRAKRQEFDNMPAPSMGGEIRPMGQGQVVRLARGSSLTDFADKIGVNPRHARHGAVQPRRDGHRDPVGQRRDAAPARHRAQLRRPGRQPRGRGPRAARELRPRVRRGRGRRVRPRSRVRRSSPSWVTSTTARPGCSTRSARRTSWRRRPAASRSTSAPTRSWPARTRTSRVRSPSSTPRVTRRSPPCVLVVRRSPTSRSSWWRPTTA